MKQATSARMKQYGTPYRNTLLLTAFIVIVAGCGTDRESLFTLPGANTENSTPTSNNNVDSNNVDNDNIETGITLTPSAAEPDTPETESSPVEVNQPPATVPAQSGSGNVLACDSPDMRSAMLALTNNARSQSRQCGGTGFPATTALVWDSRLEAAATTHNNDMVNNNFFSHTGSNGLSVSQRVSAQGYNWTAVGENIAAGQRTTESAMNDWLDSAGHCQNIMSGDYTSMAVACRVDPQSDYGVYWTAVYAR